jgi:Domain of unknown function (DUF4394)
MRRRSLMLLAPAALAAACATDAEPPGSPRRETVWALTARGDLLRVNAGVPQQVQQRVAVSGLEAGDRWIGIDFRVARGVLYALSARGRLYTLDLATGRASRVGQQDIVLNGERFAMDFNPAVDRIRVMSDSGQNLRLHPDTGAVVARDPAPAYAAGDPAVGQRPVIAAAGYTYNKVNDKLTSNYAIDLARGTLVLQGSREGVVPEVSPNTGQLFTVGALGIGAIDDAAMDIADIDNTTLAALATRGRTRLFRLDLASGQATLLGTLADGGPITGVAIEP